jgi:hypothetical protein
VLHSISPIFDPFLTHAHMVHATTISTRSWYPGPSLPTSSRTNPSLATAPTSTSLAASFQQGPVLQPRKGAPFSLLLMAPSFANLQPRSPSHQAVDVVRALVRVNWLQGNQPEPRPRPVILGLTNGSGEGEECYNGPLVVRRSNTRELRGRAWLQRQTGMARCHLPRLVKLLRSRHPTRNIDCTLPSIRTSFSWLRLKRQTLVDMPIGCHATTTREIARTCRLDTN